MLLFNHAESTIQFTVGDRVAQLVVERIATPEVIVGNHYPTQGFGSTGTSSRNPRVSAMKAEGESGEGPIKELGPPTGDGGAHGQENGGRVSWAQRWGWRC